MNEPVLPEGYRARSFVPADAPDCLAVFDANVPDFFAAAERAEFAEFLDRHAAGYVVAERAGVGIVACGGMLPSLSEPRTAVLCWGMVAPVCQGQGLGVWLLRWRLTRIAGSGGFDRVCITTSEATRGFYARHGFRAIEIIPHGLGPGRAAVRMILSLGPQS